MDDGSRWPHVFASVLNALASGFLRWQSGDWWLLILLVASLALAAMASAAETALTSVNRIKLRNLEDEGDAKAKRILRLIDQPQTFLSTILAANNIAIIVATTVATLLALDIFARAGEIISTVGLSLIVLIFCEISPKTAAVQAPERWARVLVGPVEALSFVLKPLILALTWLTARLLRVVGIHTTRRGPYLTEEELRLLVEPGGEEEVTLEEEKRDMIHNVFELGDTIVREVLVPRIDMVTIEAGASVEEAMQLIVQGGQSRIPMYEGTTDNIIGLLYAKDLLRVQARHEHPPSVRALARPVYFVPETKRLDDLLRELRGQRIHMAIVVDEYGSVAGLVTIEDLVEEIVGDIADEYDIVENLFQQIGPNEYLVDAKIGLDDLNDLLDSELTSEDYDTLGGYVYAHLDKIPTVGDTVTAQNFTFTVVATKGRRVTKVKVVRGAPTPQEERAAREAETPAAPADNSGLVGTPEPRPAALEDGDQAAESVPDSTAGDTSQPVEHPSPASDRGRDRNHGLDARTQPELPPHAAPWMDAGGGAGANATGEASSGPANGNASGPASSDYPDISASRARQRRPPMHRTHGHGSVQRRR